MNSYFLVFVCLFGGSMALKCYQGSMNTTYPLTGVATDCMDPYAITCIKQYDSYSKFATRTCSNSNCTVNGVQTREPTCFNVSSYQQNCCCYTEGCNSAPSQQILSLSMAATFTLTSMAAYFLKF